MISAKSARASRVDILSGSSIVKSGVLYGSAGARVAWSVSFSDLHLYTWDFNARAFSEKFESREVMRAGGDFVFRQSRMDDERSEAMFRLCVRACVCVCARACRARAEFRAVLNSA